MTGPLVCPLGARPPVRCSRTSSTDADPEKCVERLRHETQVHILNLLVTSLELKAPNLALYLLGYEVKKPIATTNLQDPGMCRDPLNMPPYRDASA